MESFDHLLDPKTINLLAPFGIDNKLFYVNEEIILNTWLVLFIILLLVLVLRYYTRKKRSIGRSIAISIVSAFIDLTTETLGAFHYNHTVFIGSIFIFILICNCIVVIPGADEPTRDLNTTIALGAISFLYKEYFSIKAHGFLGYLKEFTHPFAVMFPLNVIGHLSKVVSLSFRLFGNIFGGAIISTIYKGFITSSIIYQLAGLFSGLNLIVLLFFGIFEGLIQAFVFAMLSLTYLSIALQGEE
ncbi:MAG: F0F1 ATP synthase subunit A [Candidatus Babeliales bacterium]